MYKIGGVELSESEAQLLYEQEMYLITYTKIYKICYSDKKGYYGKLVYTHPRRKGEVGLVRRGRCIAGNANYVNGLLGLKAV